MQKQSLKIIWWLDVKSSLSNCLGFYEISWHIVLRDRNWNEFMAIPAGTYNSQQRLPFDMNNIWMWVFSLSWLLQRDDQKSRPNSTCCNLAEPELRCWFVWPCWPQLSLERENFLIAEQRIRQGPYGSRRRTQNRSRYSIRGQNPAVVFVFACPEASFSIHLKQPFKISRAAAFFSDNHPGSKTATWARRISLAPCPLATMIITGNFRCRILELKCIFKNSKSQ